MLNKRCYYVKGNHDIIYKKNPPLGCVDIDGKVIDHRGIKILGLEGCMWYGGRGVEYTEQQMWWKISKLKFQIWRKGGVDIILAHAPPKGIHDGRDVCHTGFKCFLKLIKKYKPQYFIHGHTHMSYGYSQKRIVEVGGTKVINVEGYYIFEVEPKIKKKRSNKKEGLLSDS